MCGRYASTRAPADLAGLFEARWNAAEALAASWNVAPTDPVWAVLEHADRDSGEVERRLRAMRWGLVPSWAKDPGVGSRMINARVETVHEKPAYRKAFTKRRCLLPADGFYEWEAVPASGRAKAYKQPYFIAPEDGAPMAMAGLYEFWRDPAVPDADDPAAWLTTCTIITTEATDAAGRVHPRMPLALHPGDYGAWLDPAHHDTHALRALLHTPADGRLAVRPVSTEVNSVRNNGPHLLDPVAGADATAPE
ncbi:SOS response-associated peptidase [Streptomyces sp. NBC_00536]|uniref:SOS response-associated peptidase n=1 Tax=Streptomyces sp. NBC_00536 TaxID=2975769 RepID=UPI002E81E324|nr:SOS response-associated peptidase [Streptomyces sp. NBC_00536]WUC77158.1 SOS response-associated peptidase [Streptomyces sp. NBC_00536]